MKFQSILTIIFLMFSSFTVEAQNFLDALTQTAEMHNESRNQNENSGELTDRDREYRERWTNLLKEAEEEFKADLNGLGEYERCVAMMLLYLDLYFGLDKKIENESDCKMKYDLYGMQLLGISASNTILYCPEKISNLSEETQEEVLSNFVGPHVFRGVDGTIYFRDDNWGPKLVRLYGKYSGIDMYNNNPELEYKGWMKWLWGHFHPAMTITKVLEIGQKMEALDCGG